MNYLRPNDLERDDDPKEWLGNVIIFATALSEILKVNEGIVIEVTDNMKSLLSDLRNLNKIIVYNGSDNMIHINECDDSLEHGRLVWMHIDDNKN